MVDLVQQQTTNIGPTITITGEIRSDENISVEGTIRGNIETSADLHVIKGGTIEATVSTRNIDVHGSISGNVTASDLFQVHVGGSVSGDVRAPRIVLSDGARYKGNIDMENKRQNRTHE